MSSNAELVAEEIGTFTHDPLKHVLYVYPWGEDGELKEFNGPRQWQREFLKGLGDRLKAGKINHFEAIQEAVASGHGIGKSALVAWLIKWALDTFRDCRGVVTANTENQLKNKTWAELAKWHRLALNRDWFVLTATALYSADPDHEKTWRVDMVAWSENKTEAFAGMHNRGKRILIIFDEASAIPAPIWEVTEGALTDEDTEILWFVFGNPTRNTGRFRECFGRHKHRWSKGKGWQIDSREVDGTNKAQLQKWVDDYGEDSDFVRVRVRGLFPNASSMQFIPSSLVAEAMRRKGEWMRGDPLIMTFDVARGGDDNCVIRFRRGLDAKSIKPIRIPGSEVPDSMILCAKVVNLIEQYKPDAFFFDETGLGGPVGDRIKQLGYLVMGINFGGHSPDPHYANMRAYMYMMGREWLQRGGALPDDPQLEMDLTSVEYSHDRHDKIILESKEHMKERGLSSPDDGDALMMSFAFHVAPVEGMGAADLSIKQTSSRAAYNPIGGGR